MAQPTPDSFEKTYLFTDLRHIRPGDLRWHSPDGEYLALYAIKQAGKNIPHPDPPVEAYAEVGFAPYGIRLMAQQPNKTDQLDKEIPGGRITFEDSLYRKWYLETEPPAICYIESKDGFEWTPPRRSPITVWGRASHEFVYFIDPNGPPEERYKAVYPVWPPEADWPALWEKLQSIHPRHRDERLRADNIRCMCGAVSPDGVQWTPLPEPLMILPGDTDTTVYYDTWLERYVMYTRLYVHDRRWIGRAEAEDFRRWGPVEPLIWPSLHWPYSYDVYTNARTVYPGLPSYHLMFPFIYQRGMQTSAVHLYSSADGICWNEVPGSPILTPGAPGEWDGEHIGVTRDLLPFGKDRVGMMYGGRGLPHKYPRWKQEYPGGSAWVWWPEGRICGLVADEVGEFFTFPVVPAGRELRLNVRARRAGRVQVGLVGVAGRSADDCDPIYGDSLAIPVHWKGETDIVTREDEAVMLHFKLRYAELFGFQWV